MPKALINRGKSSLPNGDACNKQEMKFSFLDKMNEILGQWPIATLLSSFINIDINLLKGPGIWVSPLACEKQGQI